jgi:hypothetical protein
MPSPLTDQSTFFANSVRRVAQNSNRFAVSSEKGSVDEEMVSREDGVRQLGRLDEVISR